MAKIAIVLLASIVSSSAMAQVVGPPETSSFVRNYHASQESDVSDSGPTATSATLPLSSATADYGHLTVQTLGIPGGGGTGRSAHAGAFGDSSVSDTLYFDFGGAPRPDGPLTLSFDFSVKGAGPTLDIPPRPADVGWMTAGVTWNLMTPRHQISARDFVSRYHAFWQDHESWVLDDSDRRFEPITGDFNFTVPYEPGGGFIGLVPFSYSLRCGAGNQQIVVEDAQANCLGWSFDITGIHLLDASGQIVPDLVISAASTYDYNGSGHPIFPPTNVPEPSAWLLMVVGFLGIGTMLRRNRAQGDPRPAA